MIVKFNSTDEFLDELELEKANVRGRVVRLTTRWIRRRDAVHEDIVVVAGFVADSPELLPDARPKSWTLVELEDYVGYRTVGREGSIIWDGHEDRRQARLEAIEQACERLDLEVRAGVYEAASA
jgi:hypothetical protein